MNRQQTTVRHHDGDLALSPYPGHLLANFKSSLGGTRPQQVIDVEVSAEVLDGDHITEKTNSHFQDGHAAWLYLEACCQRPINQLRIRDMNKEFDDIDIVHDIGINQNTIKTLAKTIRTVNGKRPTAPVNLRKSPDELGDSFGALFNDVVSAVGQAVSAAHASAVSL